MNKIEVEYQYLGGKHVICSNADKRAQFFDELKDGQFYKLIGLKNIEFNSHLQMKYYRSGVLGSFVPSNYDSTNDAHIHFAKEFLSELDIIECDDPEIHQKRHEIIIQVSQSIKPIVEIISYFNDAHELKYREQWQWVRSTAKLGTRTFKGYIDEIIRLGAEQDIYVKDSKQWKQDNGYK